MASGPALGVWEGRGVHGGSARGQPEKSSGDGRGWCRQPGRCTRHVPLTMARPS